MSHPDPHKMRPTELHACGCERCQDALRLHGQLDQLIQSSHRTSESITRLEESMRRIEDGLRSDR